MCLARAIIVAIEEKQKGPHWNNIRQGREIQGDLAKGLMSMAGLDDHLGVCGLQEIKAIQQAIQPRYQIKVYSKETFNNLVFQGDVVSDNVLHLYHHDNHFDVITKLPAFFGRCSYCEYCNVGYDHKSDHICNRGKCLCCGATKPCSFDGHYVYCPECNR